MKVLFAVSNESISEAIIKKYQQMYKEIISSKNVYYFNAITKELQKDKSYDRIVISEDLEPFASKNYDTIDNFLFEKLDNISDEASNVQGEDIPIILISTDRRTKGENLLVKLFGIGVYSALIGQDRSIDQVCNLINKPRSKKEAKIYYKISSNEVEYKSESEGDVSEIEIQNILAHYTRLGKNEEKYVESFNSISNQYTDQQLRLIAKFLPLNVKAVLEAKCPKYQQVVAAYTGNGSSEDGESEYRNPQSKFSKKQEKQQKNDKRAEKAGLKIESIKSERNNVVLNKPVIIPSEVTTKNIKKVETKVSNMENNKQINMQQEQKTEKIRNVRQQPMQVQPQITREKQPIQGQPQVAKEQQPKQVQPQMPREQQPIQAQPQMARVQQAQVTKEQQIQNQAQVVMPEQPQATTVEQSQIEQPKRGRGRPKKVLTEEEIAAQANMVKRKRGRPKKVQIEENNFTETLNQENPLTQVNMEKPQVSDVSQPEKFTSIQSNEKNNILSGFDDFEQEVTKTQNNNDEVLSEFENYNNENNDILPGFDDFGTENDTTLPEFNDYEEVNSLPGLNDYGEQNSETLPGFDNYNNEDNNMLPGFDDYNSESNGTLPGFDDFEEETNKTQSTTNYDDEMLPGFEGYSEEEDFSGPGGMIPEVSDYNNQDNALPGMNEYEENKLDLDNTISSFETQNNNDILSGFNNHSSNQNNNQSFSNEPIPQVESKGISSQTFNNNMNTETLISGDRKIVGFVGTSKNGTSFIVDNLAQILSSQGIKTAILDLTKNKNAYYIYTKNEEDLRKTAMECMQNLELGMAKGITVNPNLDVYTSLPGEDSEIENIDKVILTLTQKYSLILVDCDFKSDYRYIAKLQELYLVQSMDVLTIQPLTAYLRDLKAKGILDQSKLRVVINKYLRVRSLTEKTIVGGMAFYNDPAMSFMTELFNRETIKYTVIPLDTQAYSKYLEGLVNCEISTNGYSKEILAELRKLANMVYPLVTNTNQKYGKEYNKKQKAQYGQYQKSFSNEMNDTLNKMKNNY